MHFLIGNRLYHWNPKNIKKCKRNYISIFRADYKWDLVQKLNGLARRGRINFQHQTYSWQPFNINLPIAKYFLLVMAEFYSLKQQIHIILLASRYINRSQCQELIHVLTRWFSSQCVLDNIICKTPQFCHLETSLYHTLSGVWRMLISQNKILNILQGIKYIHTHTHTLQKKLLLRAGNRSWYSSALNLKLKFTWPTLIQWPQQNDFGVVLCYFRTSNGLWKRYKYKVRFFHQHWLFISALWNTSC